MRLVPSWCRSALAPLAALLCLLAAAPDARAQSTILDDTAPEAFRPAPSPPPPRPVSIEPEDDIDLPGPLPREGARVGEAGLVVVPVAGGVARIDPRDGAVTIDDRAAPEPRPEWGETPDGKMRFRALEDGAIRAEHRTRRGRWRTSWTLRVAGGTPAPPVASRRRVYFGATDNRVYSVRRRNGHRVWATDVGSRVTASPVLWESDDTPLVLVVTEGGAALTVLEARSGRQVTTWRLPENTGRLVGMPVTLADGRVALARQRYAENEASLLILRLTLGESTLAPGYSRDGAAS